ncbi:MarR family transcriptional regulator [Paenibacillus sp. 598K]|uniref:MarR family winged helix-turn-helix transcriptional regulator n=1 Tax=Paenibacillus sp. 598K TaxID=1117987 RepID=UPI000FFAFB23|nr:MarR family transcriptional regulator [Paenibacillus sp. 598K]GBF76579.1 MarR family transcriptional regulator [Paenibacillus sp. 598K]
MDTAAASMRLEDQLCFALYACSREITRSYQPVLKAMNLTYTQYLTMLVLWEQDDLTVKELGARLYLDSGTLTPLLKKLETAGLLTRIRDREDERSVRIGLTDKGRELREQGACVPPQVFGMTRVPAAKLMELYRLSHELMADLQSSERVD